MRTRTYSKISITALICVIIICIALIFTYSSPPAGFPSGSSAVIVHIAQDTSISTVAAELYSDHIVRSSLFFRIIATILGGRRAVDAGDYFFSKPEDIWTVAYRLSHSQEDIVPVRVTFPEGITVRDMGNILSADLSGTLKPGVAPAFTFDEKGFLSLASTSEGYLFPDTYLFLPNVTPETVVATMKSNFDSKISAVTPNIVAFQADSAIGLKSYPRTFANIVIMASILEKEGATSDDRRIIAGILWKRLDAGEALQVDAPFLYIQGKTSAQLTVKDLATTSPYNTYVHTGLPPTPIANPGLDALTDAVTPTTTDYWYYLSDRNGIIHYAATYKDQLANERKYVK